MKFTDATTATLRLCPKCFRPDTGWGHVCFNAPPPPAKVEYDLSPRFIRVVRMPLEDAQRMSEVAERMEHDA